MRAVVVIGGGFAGSMVVLHLARDFPGLPVSVTVVEPRAVLGAGLAYGTDDPACRINVAASRMSPFEEEPGAFDDWLSRGGADPLDQAMEARGGRFPARAVYGQYVRSLLQGTPVAHRRAEAVSVQRKGAGFAVGLSDGASLTADHVVLATGHPKPGLPRALAPVAHDPRLVRDPWDTNALRAIGPDEAILLVGTGLTACDVFAGLRARGHRAPIVAVSRRGLLPRQRTSLPVSAYGSFAEAPASTALALLRRVRHAVREAAAAGRPWEDVITALREQARTVWRALPLVEQQRLLRHARAFWDVHRYQCAPQVGDLLAREISEGRMRVHAASLGRVWVEADGLHVTAVARGGRALALRADRIVNCTGPGHAGVLSSSSLLGALAAEGLVRADGLGLGLDTANDSRAIGADGSPTDGLFIAGPPARSAHGELMGLPQVSQQPREIATLIAEHVNRMTQMVVDAQTAR